MAGGRPKGSTSIDGRVAARAHAEKALKVLVDLLTCPSYPTRVAAAEAILNRAWGRPAQAVEVTGANGGPVQHEDVTNDAERFNSAIAGIFARAGSSETSGDTQH